MRTLQCTLEQMQIHALGFQLNVFFAQAQSQQRKFCLLELVSCLRLLGHHGLSRVCGVCRLIRRFLTHNSWRSAFGALFRYCFICCPSMYSIMIVGFWHVNHVNQRRRHPSGFGFMHQLRLMHCSVTSNLLIQRFWAVLFGNAHFDDYFSPMPIGKVEAGFGALLKQLWLMLVYPWHIHLVHSPTQLHKTLIQSA